MLTLPAVGKGTAPHQKPVVEDPVTNDEFSQQSVEQEYQHPQNQEMNASKQPRPQGSLLSSLNKRIAASGNEIGKQAKGFCNSFTEHVRSVKKNKRNK